jgi:hypothetical protein
MRKLLATALALAAALVLTVGAAADDGRGGDKLTFAVIGDTPYGPAQEALFPSLVTSIDDDRDVRLALHLGDIKTGSSSTTRSCTRRATTSGRTATARSRAGSTPSSGSASCARSSTPSPDGPSASAGSGWTRRPASPRTSSGNSRTSSSRRFTSSVPTTTSSRGSARLAQLEEICVSSASRRTGAGRRRRPRAARARSGRRGRIRPVRNGRIVTGAFFPARMTTCCQHRARQQKDKMLSNWHHGGRPPGTRSPSF